MTYEEIKIIPIEEKHIESFHASLDSVCRERLYLATLQGPPLASVREFVSNNITNGVPQFVAVDSNHRVVGWCDISPSKNEGFKHCGHLGMGVSKEFRGKGVGEKLLLATLARAKQIGLERVELEVFASNVSAIELYKKSGFSVEGVKPKCRKIDGKYDDVVLMGVFW